MAFDLEKAKELHKQRTNGVNPSSFNAEEARRKYNTRRIQSLSSQLQRNYNTAAQSFNDRYAAERALSGLKYDPAASSFADFKTTLDKAAVPYRTDYAEWQDTVAGWQSEYTPVAAQLRTILSSGLHSYDAAAVKSLQDSLAMMDSQYADFGKYASEDAGKWSKVIEQWNADEYADVVRSSILQDQSPYGHTAGEQYASMLKLQQQYNTAPSDALRAEMDVLSGMSVAAGSVTRLRENEQNRKRLAEIEAEIAELRKSNEIENTPTNSRRKGLSRGTNDAAIKALLSERNDLQVAVNAYESGQYNVDKYYKFAGDTGYDAYTAADVASYVDREQEVNAVIDAFYNNEISAADVDKWAAEKGLQYRYANGSQLNQLKAEYVGSQAINNPVAFYHAVKDYTAAGRNFMTSDPRLQNMMAVGNANHWDLMTDDEVKIQAAAFSGYGESDAAAFMQGMEGVLEKRFQQKQIEDTQKMYASMPAWAAIPVGAVQSLHTVPANLVGGVVAAGGAIVDTLAGKGVDPYSDYYGMLNYATGTREAIGGAIAEATEGWEVLGVNVPSFLYNTGMSIADSAVGIATMGSLYSVVASSGAAAQKAKNLYDRGASQSQIVGGALAAGMSEYIFEKFSIDRLLNTAAEGSEHLIRQAVKNMLTQGGVETSEELATELSNILSDCVIMAGQSEMSQAIQRYVTEEGMSQEDAQKQAFIDALGQLVEAGLGGFLSGGVMGGGVSFANYFANRQADTETGHRLKESGKDAALYELAKQLNDQKMQQVAEKTAANPSDLSVGRLQWHLDNYRQQQNAADFYTALKEKGVGGRDARRIASYLADASMGAEFTDEQAAEMTGRSAVTDTNAEVFGNVDSSVNRRNALYQKADAGELLSVSEDGRSRLKDSGEAVTVEGIQTFDGGENVQVKVRTADGETKNVPLGEMQFSSREEATLVGSIRTAGYDGSSAELMLKGFRQGDDPSVYSASFALAWNYGKRGATSEYTAERVPLSPSFSAEQRRIAYEAGRSAAELSVKKQQEVASSRKVALSKSGVDTTRIDGMQLTKSQQEQIEALDALGKAINVRIHLYDSRTGTVPNKNTADNGGVKYQAKADSSIKQQIQENLPALRQMEVVERILYDPVNKKQLKEQVIQDFKKIGYRVERQDIGVIEIGEKEIDKSLNYIGTDAEKAALFAIPKVLKRGKIISGHPDHKSRSYDTITIAAPITINGKMGIVGAVVRKTSGNRYYTHRIIMPDGSSFIFEPKKVEPTSSDVLTTQRDKQGTDIGSTNNSISKKSANVNPDTKKSHTSGLYFVGSNDLYVDIHAGISGRGTMLYTAAHELTHYIADWSPSEFKHLSDFLVKELSLNGQDVEDLMMAKRATLAAAGETDLTDDAIWEEVVCDACETFLTSEHLEESLSRLAKQHKPLHTRILSWLKKFFGKLKSALQHYRGVEAETDTGRIVAEMTDSMQQLVDLWSGALLNASQNAQAANDASAISPAGVAKKQIASDFYSTFDAWDGKNPSVSFTLGNTSEPLQSIGVKNQDLVLRSGTVLQKINKHEGITRETFRQIPELLEHPIIVQFSDAIDPKTGKSKYESRITVLGELYAEVTVNGKKEKKPVLVSVELLPTNRAKTQVLDISLITSAYAKDALQQYLNENSILYVEPNKKRTDNWLSLNRLQLPVGENRYGSIRSITYDGGKVKIQNSTKMTEMQRALQAAGVVDSYGHSMLETTDDDTYKASFSSRSVREALAEALDSEDLSEKDRKTLESYRNGLQAVEEAQVRLDEYNKQLHEMFTQKGPRGPEYYEQFTRLSAEAKAAAETVQLHDAKLLRMASMAPIRQLVLKQSDQAYKRARQEGREQLKAYREQQERQALTERVYRVTRQLRSKLLAGSKNRNVKSELQEAVTSSLYMSDMLMQGEITPETIVRLGAKLANEQERPLVKRYAELLRIRENAAKRAVEGFADTTAIDRELERLEEKLSDLFSRERARLQLTDVPTVLSELKRNVQALLSSGESYVRENEYVKQTLNAIEALSEDMLGVTRDGLTNDQLYKIAEVLSMLQHTASQADRLFGDKKKQSVLDTAHAVAEEMDAAVPRGKDQQAEWLLTAEKMQWNNTTPIYAFERVGSETFRELYWGLMRGQNTYAQIKEDGTRFLQEQRKKYGYDTWAQKQTYDFPCADGKTIRLNLQQMMAVYALSRRDKALPHMQEGGLVFDSKETFPRDKYGIIQMVHQEEYAYRVTEQTLDAIRKTLTDEQRAFVEATQAYLSDTLAKSGNRVSRELYGIDLFMEKVYFPMQTAAEYRSAVNDALQQTATPTSLKNTGMTKQTKPNAKNPLVLRGYEDVWAQHVETMSQYCGMVLPVENLQRVFNHSEYVKESDDLSIRAKMRGKFGEGAVQYFTDFVRDVNGGVISSPSRTGLAEKAFSNFKKTAVGLSASVVVQQPTAIVRAMAVIDPKYFAGARPITNKNAAQAGGGKYHLIPYSETQIKDWENSKRIVLYKGEQQFREFIRNALTGKSKTNKKLYFGAISSALASKIKQETGVDVEGYNLSLGEDEIRKINKDHGTEETELPRGQRPVTEDDYVYIPTVIQEADQIEPSEDNYNGKPVIRFRKFNGNERVTVVAVVSDKRLDLFVQTSYINKKGSMATPKPVQAGFLTSETPGGTAPTNSISVSFENVKTYEWMRKYAPGVTLVKEMGGFDVGGGRGGSEYITAREYAGAKAKAKGLLTDAQYRDEIFMKGAELADKLGWTLIGRAVEREIADTTDLQPGTEEFFQACGQRFTEVIAKTQVYDSVLSRSGVMRSKNTLDRMLTQFMGEPTLSYNMLSNAVVQLAREWDGNKKAAIRRFAKTVAPVYVSIILANALASIVYAMRDDDEDETFLEKWLESVSDVWVDMLPFSMMPYVRDIVSLIVTGYDIERPDMTLASDVVSAFKKLGSEKVSTGEKIQSLASVFSLFGIPVKNVIREVRAIWNTTALLFGGTDGGSGTEIDRGKAHSLYRAVMSGDEARTEKARSGYDSDEAYLSAVSQAIRTYDPRVKSAAAKAVLGDFSAMSHTAGVLQSEGKIDEDTAIRAVRGEYDYLQNKLDSIARAALIGDTAQYEKARDALADRYDGILTAADIERLAGERDVSATASTSSTPSLYSASDVGEAFAGGGTDNALEIVSSLYQQKIDEYTAAGESAFNAKKKARSAISSSLTRQFKALYIQAYLDGDTAEQRRIKSFLRESGMYNDLADKLNDWRSEARKQK